MIKKSKVFCTARNSSLPAKKRNHDKMNILSNDKGSMLVVVLLLTELFMAITIGAIGLSLMQQKLNMSKVASNQAIHIAEAGVNYYRWVLYHNPEEYCNKEVPCLNASNGHPDNGPYGPYEYKDASGNITGYYELYITPPAINGSSIVKVKSVGWEAGHPNVKRSIEVQCGMASWSNYSTLANDVIRFGEGTEVWGPIHSNVGVRFDGIAHNIITSSADTYDDPDHIESGDDVLAFGVHTHVGVGLGTYDNTEEGNPPTLPAPIRSDVFLSGRSFPTPVVSFDLLNDYVNDTYAKATPPNGMIIDPRSEGVADANSEPTLRGCISGACDEGFHITMRTDNRFDIRRVSAVRPECNNNPEPDSPSFSIQTEGTAQTFDIPANGIIFVKNHVWVDGQINNSKVTILAFMEPFTADTANIITNNDLLYTNYDGTDSIGLIAQGDIGTGLYSEGSFVSGDDGELRIDAAMIAKSGRVGREYYKTSCSNEFHKRNKITIYGSLSTKQRYGFSYSCGVSNNWCSGYDIRNIIYDNNLTFYPPPHFPSTGEYTFISWKED